MFKKLSLTAFLVLTILNLWSQLPDSTNFSIYYSSPKKYTIQSIDIVGVKYLDKEMLREYSGLSVGDEIIIPGDKITAVIS